MRRRTRRCSRPRLHGLFPGLSSPRSSAGEPGVRRHQKGQPLHFASETERLFRAELKRRGIQVLRTEEGRFVVSILGAECSVSLDNIERNIARDRGGARAIGSFVEGLLATQAELPEWAHAESGVRLSLEASDYDFGT